MLMCALPTRVSQGAVHLQGRSVAGVRPPTPDHADAMATSTIGQSGSGVRIVSDVANKPIRVDNWGNFLAQRIEALYDKQEHCDLTLRFPHGDLKVGLCDQHFTSPAICPFYKVARN